MFTFTDANDIEWAHEPCESVEQAHEEGRKYFGDKIAILIGEIGIDNKVTPIENIEVTYGNAQEWGEITHPHLGRIMTYYPLGAPAYDSYTKPFVDNDGDICCYKFDHDAGFWTGDTIVIGEYTGEKIIDL